MKPNGEVMARFVVSTRKEPGHLSGDDLTLGKMYRVEAEESGMYRVFPGGASSKGYASD